MTFTDKKPTQAKKKKKHPLEDARNMTNQIMKKSFILQTFDSRGVNNMEVDGRDTIMNAETDETIPHPLPT